MKKILTIILAGVSTLAIAQKKSNLSRSIDDDGKTLSIKVTGTIDGKDIDFERSFDVKGMSNEERMALRDQVLDSIGSGNLNLPEPPKPKSAPSPVVIPPTPAKPRTESAVFHSDDNKAENWVSVSKPYESVPGTSDIKEFSKQVKVSPEAGEMFLRYRFVQKGDEFIFEKTVGIEDKSESQRQRIIEDFEKEIGLPGKGMEM